jgi:hypothetical protein
MSYGQFCYELCAILGLNNSTATHEEILQTVEEVVAIAATGDIPATWTVSE